MSTTTTGLRFGSLRTNRDEHGAAATLVCYTPSGQAREVPVSAEQLASLIKLAGEALRLHLLDTARRANAWAPRLGDEVLMPADEGYIPAVVVERFENGAVRCAYQHETPGGPFYMSVAASELRPR